MDKFSFLIAEGFKNIFRHKLTSFATIFSVFLTLSIVGFLILANQNTNKIIEYLSAKYKIEVFFNLPFGRNTADEILDSGVSDPDDRYRLVLEVNYIGGPGKIPSSLYEDYTFFGASIFPGNKFFGFNRVDHAIYILVQSGFWVSVVF